MSDGSVIGRIRRDPAGFCERVLRFAPWSRQRAILESVRDHRRTSVRSCHGSGKTRIGAASVLWWMAAHPNSTVITTAPTWTQVREQLWREIARLHHEAGGFFDGELHDTRFELAPDWFAIGLSTDVPSRFAGYHSEHLLVVVDEAGGVDEQIYEATESLLTSEGSRLLLLGNPTNVSGTHFGSFHAQRQLYNGISISAFDTPAFTGERVPPAVLRNLTSPEYVDTMRSKYGEQSPVWQVRVLGEFPTATDTNVIAFGELEAARARSAPSVGPLVVACDVARFGSDETVIVVRSGDRVRIANTAGGRDTMQTAGAILRVAREAAASFQATPTIVVDDAGVGGGVVDRLREIGAYEVVAFNGGGRPAEPDEYPNCRSEAWFRFAEQLPGIDLDPDEQLAADLLAPTYAFDSRGRRVVEQKAMTKGRLGRSPDRADAVLMAFHTTRDNAVSQHAIYGGVGGSREPVIHRGGGLTLVGRHHIDQR